MPNTLAHFGVQGLLSHTFLPKSARMGPSEAAPWILLGCVLPDFPWILQRVVRAGLPGVDPFSLRLYAIVQASLFVTLFLCLGIALLSRRPGTVFGILSSNALLHLLLDATQTKWGNGVHLFAPFSWEIKNFAWYWPESLPTYVLTAAGALYLVWIAYRWKPPAAAPSSRRPRGTVAIFLGLYFVLPFFFMDSLQGVNSHYVSLLRIQQDRLGQPVELDRTTLSQPSQLKILSGEQIKTTGLRLPPGTRVSVRGEFVDNETIEVHAWHHHPKGIRELFSYIGLGALLLVWGRNGIDLPARRTSRGDP